VPPRALGTFHANWIGAAVRPDQAPKLHVPNWAGRNPSNRQPQNLATLQLKSSPPSNRERRQALTSKMERSSGFQRVLIRAGKRLSTRTVPTILRNQLIIRSDSWVPVAYSWAAVSEAWMTAILHSESCTDDQLIAQMVGRSVDNLFPARISTREPDERPIFEVRAWRRSRF